MDTGRFIVVTNCCLDLAVLLMTLANFFVVLISCAVLLVLRSNQLRIKKKLK